MRRTPLLALVALLGLTALAGCGADGTDEDTDGGATTTEAAPDGPWATEPGTAPAVDDVLAERTFHVAEVTGHDLAPGSSITLSFQGGQVGVDAGCNQLSGPYALEGSTLVVEDLGGTEMGCDPALVDQDAWVAAFLADRPTVEVQAGEASALRTDEVALRLVRPTPEPPAELVGPTWTLDTITEGGGPDGTASSVPAGVVATLTFADDGTYQLAAGCNAGSGTWVEAGAGILQVDPPALTRMRCGDDVMAVEGAVLAGLDGEVTASIEGTRLTLATTGGGDPDEDGSRSGASLGFTAG